jgi:hypothetical protein
MATLEKWYAYETPRATRGIDRYPVASLVDMPPHMGTAGRSTGAQIAQQLRAAGWGVVFLPEGGKGTLVRVGDAEQAQKLTLGDPTETAVVLGEPADGWQDTGALASVGRYAVFPAMLVVGFVATMAATAAVRG